MTTRHRQRWERQPGCVMDFPRLYLPDYPDEETFGTVGQVWHLDKVSPMVTHPETGQGAILQRGYWSGLNWEPTFHRLSKGQNVWMTTSRMEQESHGVHLKHAKGVVVVCGVGLGMYLYNLCLKPEVTAVVAIENNPDIMGWAQRQSATWPNIHKVNWWWGDALDFTMSHLSRYNIREVPDYLYVDIWPTLNCDKAVPQTRRIQSELHAKSVGWWGQELAFVHWCAKKGIARERVCLDDFDRWCLDLDMVVPGRSGAYLRYCFQVALNQTLR